jgi:hypothetical protein
MQMTFNQAVSEKVTDLQKLIKVTTEALNSKIEDLALNGPYLEEIEEQTPEEESESPRAVKMRRRSLNKSPMSKFTSSSPQLREGEELKLNVSALELSQPPDIVVEA